jgi:hypothetical protein
VATRIAFGRSKDLASQVRLALTSIGAPRLYKMRRDLRDGIAQIVKFGF